MDYARLAGLVARDLTNYLARRIPELGVPVYAVGLYIEDDYAVTIATEREFQRQASGPYYQRLPEALYGPAGPRWYAGNWEIPSEPFLTAEAEEPLAPPITRPWLVDSLEISQELICATSHQFEELAFRALELATPLPMLSPSALAWVQIADVDDIYERTASMLRTNPIDRLRRTFPEWRRLAELLPAARADPDRVQEIRERVERGPDDPDQPAPDELTAVLRSCGLGLDLVLTEDHDALYQVLKLANQLS